MLMNQRPCGVSSRCCNLDFDNRTKERRDFFGEVQWTTYCTEEDQAHSCLGVICGSLGQSTQLSLREVKKSLHVQSLGDRDNCFDLSSWLETSVACSCAPLLSVPCTEVGQERHKHERYQPSITSIHRRSMPAQVPSFALAGWI